MTWEEIKQRKEDSIRESTDNPMSKSFEVNGKIYNSYTEYSNSNEHKELLKIQEEALEQFEQKAKEYYEISRSIFLNNYGTEYSHVKLLDEKIKELNE